MTPTAGALRITMRQGAGGAEAEIAMPPAIDLGALMTGRPAEDVARTVPLIWNICAAAQEAAARSALGLEPAEGAAARLALETLRETVLKLCITWPEAAGIEPDRAAPGLCARALEDGEACGALIAALFAPLAQAPQGWDELEAWIAAGQTVPARLAGHLRDGWDPAWGCADLPLFDAAAAVDWPRATQGGQPVENGPAARHREAALLDEIAVRRGHGPLWRMAARLLDASAALAGGGTAPPPTARGVAHAARGAMLVRGRVDGHGMVEAMERLSPTDFACAPDGLLDRALASLPADPPGGLERAARLVVETVDPCLPWSLTVADAAEAPGDA